MPSLCDKDIGGLDVAMHYALHRVQRRARRLFQWQVEAAFRFPRLAPRSDVSKSLRLEIPSPGTDGRLACQSHKWCRYWDDSELGRLCLALESGQGLGVHCHIVGQKFQRDKPVQGYVFGLINNAHAATAQLLDDSVVRDGLTDHVKANVTSRHWGSQ